MTLDTSSSSSTANEATSHMRPITRFIEVASSHLTNNTDENVPPTAVTSSIRRVLPLLSPLRPSVDSLATLVDDRIEGFVLTGQKVYSQKVAPYIEWREANLGESASRVSKLTGLTNVKYPLVSSKVTADFRGIISNRVDLATKWFDQRLDILILSSESFVDYYLPPPISSPPQTVEEQTRVRRLLSIPTVKIPGRVGSYIIVAVDRAKGEGQKMVDQLRQRVGDERCSSMVRLLRGPVVWPTTMPVKVGHWMRVSVVQLRAGLDQWTYTHRCAALFADVDLEKMVEMKVKAGIPVVKEYYNAWMLPTLKELQQSVRVFQRKVIHMLDYIPEEQRKVFIQLYKRLYGQVKSYFGNRVSPETLHYFTQSVFVHWMDSRIRAVVERVKLLDASSGPSPQDISSSAVSTASSSVSSTTTTSSSTPIISSAVSTPPTTTKDLPKTTTTTTTTSTIPTTKMVGATSGPPRGGSSNRKISGDSSGLPGGVKTERGKNNVMPSVGGIAPAARPAAR